MNSSTVQVRPLPHFDGCVRLINAAVRCWTRDALEDAQRGDERELRRLADWLRIDVDWLRRHLEDARLSNVRQK